jgi:2'-5' RNA ligase
MMHRLFVALRPPYAMRQQLLDAMGGVPNARWQQDEQLHLTLRYIGEIDRPQADDVAHALAAIDHPCPTIALAGTGSFDRKGKVHTLWAGIAADPALERLQARIERALTRLGIPPEPRIFKPHITLARINREAGPIEPFLARSAGLTSAPVTIDAFLLFESRLGGEGATYEAIARYPLR